MREVEEGYELRELREVYGDIGREVWGDS